MDALKDHNLKADKDFIITFESLSFEEGEKATKKLLDLPIPPDGIFAANDTTAVSAIMYAKKRGIKIPDELAVIGFNDDPIASIVEPALSTVIHPAIKMGQLSAKRILQHAVEKDEEVLFETSILPTELCIRNSSLKNK